VASSIPVFMLALGACFFGQRITGRQVLGAVLSIAGVLLVLCRGELAQLVPGLAWAGLFAAVETVVMPQSIQWGLPLAAALAFVAIGPAIIAYRCWGMGV